MPAGDPRTTTNKNTTTDRGMEIPKKKDSSVKLLVDAMLSFHTTVDGKTKPDLLKAVRENEVSQLR